MLDNKLLNLRSKQGQIGATTTWIVATVIIIVILLIFFYATNLLAAETLIVELEQSVVSLSFLEGETLMGTKTVVAYLQTSAGLDKDVVEDWASAQDIDLEEYID